MLPIDPTHNVWGLFFIHRNFPHARGIISLWHERSRWATGVFLLELTISGKCATFTTRTSDWKTTLAGTLCTA